MLLINGFDHVINLCFLLIRKLQNQSRAHLTERLDLRTFSYYKYVISML
jgi:hypothetical protein